MQVLAVHREVGFALELGAERETGFDIIDDYCDDITVRESCPFGLFRGSAKL